MSLAAAPSDDAVPAVGTTRALRSDRTDHGLQGRGGGADLSGHAPPPLAAALTLLRRSRLMPAAAHASVGIGIADNKPDMFGDARFQALHLGYARLDLRWDVFSDADAPPRSSTRGWPAPQATGARPLVTFDRSPQRASYNPTPQQLVGAMKALRARYPVRQGLLVLERGQHEQEARSSSRSGTWRCARRARPAPSWAPTCSTRRT